MTRFRATENPNLLQFGAKQTFSQTLVKTYLTHHKAKLHNPNQQQQQQQQQHKNRTKNRRSHRKKQVANPNAQPSCKLLSPGEGEALHVHGPRMLLPNIVHHSLLP
jgi:hypothetical protein